MDRIDFINKYDYLLNQENTYVIAQTTNCMLCKRSLDLIEDEVNNMWRYGLDIRLFNEDGEVKWFRPSIDMEFIKRERLNDEDPEIDYMDEEQYLDIDTSKSSAPSNIYATGGGRYALPICNLNDAKIVIRNYLSYEAETGCAQVIDWRIVKFVEGVDSHE